MKNHKGNISYIYDATGNKLEKITEEQNPTTKSTYTTYLGGDVYENNILKIISQEEGRVRRELKMEYHYDYFLKDHLGNVRTVFRPLGSPCLAVCGG